MTNEANRAVQIFQAHQWLRSLPDVDGLPIVTTELREPLAALATHYVEVLEENSVLRQRLARKGKAGRPSQHTGETLAQKRRRYYEAGKARRAAEAAELERLRRSEKLTNKMQDNSIIS